MSYIVELEPNVYIADDDDDGDPARTLVFGSAKRCFFKADALHELVRARKYMPFANARVINMAVAENPSDRAG